MALSDKALGAALLVLSIFIFVYYSSWILLLVSCFICYSTKLRRTCSSGLHRIAARSLLTPFVVPLHHVLHSYPLHCSHSWPVITPFMACFLLASTPLLSQLHCSFYFWLVYHHLLAIQWLRKRARTKRSRTLVNHIKCSG